MKSFCSSKEKCYFGGQMRDKLGEKRQIWKLKNKNLQKLVQFLMLEIKRITSCICRWYVFFAKNHFPTQNLLSDAEVTICKYKYLIISTNTFVLGRLK